MLIEESRLTHEDHQCFEEIKDILMKHRMAENIGISLIHDDFPIDEQNEILIETNLASQKTIRTKVVRKEELSFFTIPRLLGNSIQKRVILSVYKLPKTKINEYQ